MINQLTPMCLGVSVNWLNQSLSDSTTIPYAEQMRIQFKITGQLGGKHTHKERQDKTKQHNTTQNKQQQKNTKKKKKKTRA